jgi:hypothetical protein
VFGKASDDIPRHDSLTESDLVGDEEAPHTLRIAQHLARGADRRLLEWH